MLSTTRAALRGPPRVRIGTAVTIKAPPSKPTARAVEDGSASTFAGSIRVPLASGRVTRAVADNVFLVEFDRDNTGSRRLQIGDRVWRKLHPKEEVTEGLPSEAQRSGVPSGVCTHCNGQLTEALADAAARADEPKVDRVSAVVLQHNNSGTYAVMDDRTDMFHAAVSRADLARQATSSPISSHGKSLDDLAQWLRDKAMVTKRHAYIAACSLYRRGWRADDVHLVDDNDVHMMRSMPRFARVAIREAALLEKELRRTRRELDKESVLEEDWRYFLSKYARVWGAGVAGFGALSAYMWNSKNHQRSLRPAQIEIACEAWLAEGPGTGSGERSVIPAEAAVAAKGRRRALEKLRRIFGTVDPLHPRVTVVAGHIGVGKSALIRAAAKEEGLPTVFVELRGDAANDPVSALVRALKVPNIGVCGGLFGFVEEVAAMVAESTGGKLPLVVLKVRDDALDRAVRDAEILGCDRRVAHLVIEVSSERGKLALLRRPRMEMVSVGEFSPEEAREYVGKRVDPVALEEFMEVIGTNSSDLDEFIAATVHRGIDPFDFVAAKLQRSIADVRMLTKSTHAALTLVAEQPYRRGEALSVAATESMPRLLEVLHYNPTTQRFGFRTRALYNASQVVLGSEAQQRIVGARARDHPSAAPSAAGEWCYFDRDEHEDDWDDGHVGDAAAASASHSPSPAATPAATATAAAVGATAALASRGLRSALGSWFASWHGPQQGGHAV